MKGNSRGFTLLEMLIVLALVAAAAGMVTMRMTRQEELLFLRRTVLALQQARMQAMQQLMLAKLFINTDTLTAECDEWRKQIDIPEHTVLRMASADAQEKNSRSEKQASISVTLHSDGSATFMEQESEPTAPGKALEVVFGTDRIYHVRIHPFDGVRCTRFSLEDGARQ